MQDSVDHDGRAVLVDPEPTANLVVVDPDVFAHVTTSALVAILPLIEGQGDHGAGCRRERGVVQPEDVVGVRRKRRTYVQRRSVQVASHGAGEREDLFCVRFAEARAFREVLR